MKVIEGTENFPNYKMVKNNEAKLNNLKLNSIIKKIKRNVQNMKTGTLAKSIQANTFD